MDLGLRDLLGGRGEREREREGYLERNGEKRRERECFGNSIPYIHANKAIEIEN